MQAASSARPRPASARTQDGDAPGAQAASKPEAPAEVDPAETFRGFVEAALRARAAAPGSAFGKLLDRSGELRMQVVVGKPVRVGKGHKSHWRLVQDAYRLDAEYFYPASAIKLCLAVTALAELRQLGKKVHGLDRATPLAYLPLFGGRRQDADPTSADGKISLEWEIRKALVVSDNDAYNRLYEFSGHREANERMWAAGLPTVRIWHRLNSARTTEENLHTPRIELLLGDPQAARRKRQSVPERISELELAPREVAGLDVGDAYTSSDGKTRTEGPMDFREKNAVSLADLQRLLSAIVRPEVDAGVHDLGILESDRIFLRAALAEDVAALNPKVWSGPDYEELDFRPSLAGVLRVRDRETLEFRGKAGRAYGFHVENAYYRDKKTGRAFFLAAAIYANKDGVVNDGIYEYAGVTEPFMKDLGEIFARAILDAPKTQPPKPHRPK